MLMADGNYYKIQVSSFFATDLENNLQFCSFFIHIVGLKEFKILPLEPVDVNSITIGGSGGAVSLKQIYKNLKIYGVTKGLKNSDFEFV